MKKHSVFNRLTGIVLAAVMLFAMIPFVGAEDVLTENYIGDGVEYTFDWSTGKLTITGSGNIADFAFQYLDDIQSVEICDGITGIGYGSFWGCHNLTTVTMADSVSYLSDSSFEECYSLSDITLSSNIVCLPQSVFKYCAFTSFVDEYNAIREIGCGAFHGCTNLSSIEISNSLKYIVFNAFYDTALTDIVFNGTEEEFFAIGIEAGNDKFLTSSVALGDGGSIEFTDWAYSDEFCHMRWNGTRDYCQVADHSREYIGSDGYCDKYYCSVCGAAFEERRGFEVGLGAGTLHIGKEFTLKIDFRNINGIHSAGIWYEYDNSIFEFVDGNCLRSGASMFDASEVDGTIAAFDSAVEAGEIFELTFRVKDDVPVGEYDIYFDCIAEDADYEKYEYGIINRFHVLECERGDFNYDDRINSADVIYLVRSVLNPDKYSIDQDGDLNRDGVFNTEDALYLLRHIMHGDRYPLENQYYNDNPPPAYTG